MTDAQRQIELAVESIAAFYGQVVPDDLASPAYEGMANRWSEFGTADFPAPDLLRVLIQATELGYAAALQDVRDGAFDSEVVEWRPSLPEARRPQPTCCTR